MVNDAAAAVVAAIEAVLADYVFDCQDSLEVHRGRTEERIPLSNVSGAEVTSHAGFHRITIRLYERAKLGRQIEFLPPSCVTYPQHYLRV